MVSHHFAKFGGHRHCNSGDIMSSMFSARLHMLPLKSAVSIYLWGIWLEKSTRHVILKSPVLIFASPLKNSARKNKNKRRKQERLMYLLVLWFSYYIGIFKTLLLRIMLFLLNQVYLNMFLHFLFCVNL